MDSPDESGDQVSTKSSAKRTRFSGLSQRFEESRKGRWVITAAIIVIIGTQAVWSIPDSAIRRGLLPVVEPANAINVNQRWLMFAPEIGTRTQFLEVHVTMADGNTRVWSIKPNPLLERVFLPNRWDAINETSIRQQDGRREYARWVADQVSGPGDKPVKVVMLFHFKVLPAPGQPSKGSTGTRVLYEENLAGKQ